MIYDLIEFGKWLSDNRLDDFGKTIHDTDMFLKVNYKNGNFTLNENFEFKENLNSEFYEKSIFSNEPLFPPKPVQNYSLPNNNALTGFSPFLIKLSDNKKKNINKIERSLNAHFDNKKKVIKKDSVWNKVLIEIYENPKTNFIEKCNIPWNKNNIIEFFEKFTVDEINEIIKRYYEFLKENTNKIINCITLTKNKEEYKSKKQKGEFYLYCPFNNKLDLINDIFYYYSKFIKERNKSFKTTNDSYCVFCGRNEVTYPSSPYFGKKDEFYFNKTFKNKFYRLKICKKCNAYLSFAELKLKDSMGINVIIIPSKKYGNFNTLTPILNKNCDSFKKLNELLKDCINFNFDLIFYYQDKALLNINKYIENYKAFLIKFKDLYIYKNGKLNFLYDEKISKDNNKPIRNLFDLEWIFKEFFINIENNKIIYLKNFYFYEIYTTNKVKDKIKILDSTFASIFYKYMEDIFSIIYEVNFDRLSIEMLNEITLYSLKILQKNIKRDEKGYFNFRLDILKRINNNLFIRNKFLGDKMLEKENTKNIEIYLNNVEDNEEKIFDLINKDIAIKYYLIGQFIRYIDNFKFKNNKNSNVFSNFTYNVHRNNIKELFVNEVLIKNQFYINQMSKKGKFIFNIFKSDYDNIFNEKTLKFEDYILLIFTGYYTKNILKNEEGESNEQ